MSHTKQTPSAGANYTMTRRIRPTPRAEISGVVPTLSLSPVGAGTTTGLVPGGPALRVFGPASSQAASSQRRPPVHLPSVKTPETKVQRMNAKHVPEAHIIVRPSEHPVGGGLSDSTPATHRPQRRPRGRVMRLWKIANVVLGYLVFGLPALLAIPALIATAAEFGLWPTITHAGPPALLASLPLLVWVWYTRRPPSTRSRRLAWIVLATLATATLLATPLFFWTAPAFAVLTSELLRALAPQPVSLSSPKAPR